MAKIKYIEYKHGGEIYKKQYLYFCLGCGFEHAFGLKSDKGNHYFNNDLENPTISPSLLQNWDVNKICHSFIKDGNIQYLNDCWHHLKGQTIELPQIS